MFSGLSEKGLTIIYGATEGGSMLTMKHSLHSDLFQQIVDQLIEQLQFVYVQAVIHVLPLSLGFYNTGSAENGQVLTRNGLFQSHFNKHFRNGNPSFAVNEFNHFLPEFMVDGPECQSCFFDIQMAQRRSSGSQLIVLWRRVI